MSLLTFIQGLNSCKGLRILIITHLIIPKFLNDVIFLEFILTHFFQYVKANQYQVTPLGMSNSQVMLTQEKPFYSPFMLSYIKAIESR